MPVVEIKEVEARMVVESVQWWSISVPGWLRLNSGRESARQRRSDGPKQMFSALATLRLRRPAWFGSGSMFVVSMRLGGTAVVRNLPWACSGRLWCSTSLPAPESQKLRSTKLRSSMSSVQPGGSQIVHSQSCSRWTCLPTWVLFNLPAGRPSSSEARSSTSPVP